MNAMGKHWFPIALVVLVAAITLWIWKPWGAPEGQLPNYGQAPDFQLEDTSGKQVALSDSQGKVRLVYYFYSYCPDICIPTTAMISKLQEELKSRGLFGDKSVIYSISFDPDRDTKERLKKFAEGYQADFTGWKFLRGKDDKEIQALGLKYKISILKDEKGNFTHQNIFTLVDVDGNIRQYYSASDPNVVASGELIGRIADDIEKIAP